MKINFSNDNSLLFSSTSIPDVFFSNTLPKISADSTKVYLYLLYYAKNDNNVELDSISKNINLSLAQIQDAFSELEENNLIIKLPNGYTIANLQEQYLNKVYAPKVTSSVEDIKRINENSERAKSTETINNLFFDGVMNSTWSTAIDLWYNKYGFSEEVMIALFNYAKENTPNINTAYVQTIAESWHKDGIKTFDDLEKVEIQKEKNSKVYKQIATTLGLKRNLINDETAYIQKWTNDYGYNIDIIEEALKKAGSLTHLNFKYFDTILTDWHEKGLITLDDIQSYKSSKKDQASKIKQIEKKAIDYNYTQSSFDNIDDIYEN